MLSKGSGELSGTSSITMPAADDRLADRHRLVRREAPQDRHDGHPAHGLLERHRGGSFAFAARASTDSPSRNARSGATISIVTPRARSAET